MSFMGDFINGARALWLSANKPKPPKIVTRSPLFTPPHIFRRKNVLVLTNHTHRVPSVTPPPTQKPWAYGHYVAPFASSDSTAQMQALGGPGIQGFLKRATWRNLEGPTEGDYDFSVMDTDLPWAKAHGYQMIYLIQDRSYGTASANGPRMLPVYLDNETFLDNNGNPVVGYEQLDSGSAPGYCGLRWKPRVIACYNNLVNAMAAHVTPDGYTLNDHPNFYGIAIQETALGFSGAQLTLWNQTGQNYQDSYSGPSGILRNASTVMNKCKIFFIFNFLAGGNYRITDICVAAAGWPNNNVFGGGPDLAPETFSLNHVGSGNGISAFPQHANIRAAAPGFRFGNIFSAPEYGGADVGVGIQIHSTFSAYSTAPVPNITNITKANPAVIRVGTATQPYQVGDFIRCDSVLGMTQMNGIDVKVNAIGGSAGAWTATTDQDSSGFTPYTSGGNAPYFWRFQEYYDWAKMVMSNPAYSTHPTIRLNHMFWYPTNSAIFDWDNGTASDAKSFIAANPLISNVPAP